MIREKITYEVKCSRCNASIGTDMTKAEINKVKEPLSIDEGCAADCRVLFKITIEHNSYGSSYNQSYLCDKCKIIALKGALKILESKINN